MSPLKILDDLQRRVAELRALQKATMTLPVVTNRCAYCGSAFSSWPEFSRHLKTCKDFRKQVQVDPWQGDSPLDGFNIAPPRIRHRPLSEQDERSLR